MTGSLTTPAVVKQVTDVIAIVIVRFFFRSHVHEIGLLIKISFVSFSNLLNDVKSTCFSELLRISRLTKFSNWSNACIARVDILFAFNSNLSRFLQLGNMPGGADAREQLFSFKTLKFCDEFSQPF